MFNGSQIFRREHPKLKTGGSFNLARPYSCSALRCAMGVPQ